MTAMLGERMVLAGYVTLTKNGFCLPTYGAGPRPNTWNVAIPEIDGDHAAPIDRFEMLEQELVEILPDEHCIEVRVGEPWREVFLWDGAIFTGTAREIFEATQHLHDEISVEAPLTMLDLSLAADAEGTAELTGRAAQFLSGKLGHTAGKETFREVVARPSVLLALRRQHKAAATSDTFPPILHEFQLEGTVEGQYQIDLPKASIEALGGKQGAAALDVALDVLGKRLGMSFDVVVAEAASTVPPTEAPSQEPENLTAEIPPILVIIPGENSYRIGRGLKFPGEMRLENGAVLRSVEGKNADLFSRPSLTIIDEIPDIHFIDAYPTVLWLLDNEVLSDKSTLRSITALLAHRAAHSISLLAPIPPQHEPSLILAPLAGMRRLLGQFSAVIDTTIVRSPFWRGERNSNERHMVDIAMRVAVATAVDEPLRFALVHAKRRKTPTLLSLVRDTGNVRTAYDDYSELTAVRHADSWKHNALNFLLDEGRGRKPERYSIQVKPLDGAFDAFTLAIVSDTLRKWRSSAAFGIFPVPDKVHPLLKFPEMAAGVSLKVSEYGKPFVVTAETPTIDAVSAACSRDLRIFRYTDEATLNRHIRQHAGPFSQPNRNNWLEGDLTVPDQVLLPEIFIRDFADGIAAKGVDPRDVLRMPTSDWVSFERKYPESRLHHQTFQFKGSIGLNLVEPEIALANYAVFEEADDGDILAQHLMLEFFKGLRSEDRIARRSARKIEAWAQRPWISTRWLVAETGKKIRLGILEDGELPSHRLFAIEGDESVPLMLRSRPFAVWVRALAAPGRGAFRLTADMIASFPIPPFLEYRVTGDTTQIHFKSDHRGRDSLARNVYESVPRALMSELTHEFQESRSQSIVDRFNEMLLEDLRLGEGARDIEILERLIERNLDGSSAGQVVHF